MKLFGLNITRASAPANNQNSKIQNQKSFSPEWADWMAGGPDPTDRGPTLSNAYEQVVWVYRAANVLAEQVANIPFLFSAGERGREHLITAGPLHDFYARPHPGLNRFQYWELRVLWLMLRGECIRIPIFRDNTGTLRLSTGAPIDPLPGSEDRAGDPFAVSGSQSKIKNQNSKIHQVLFLDPAYFQHVVQGHRLVGWRYTNRGSDAPIEPQVFLPEEIWFEKLPNPFDHWRGLPPLATAELAARTDFAAASFMRGLIENNAENGLLVRTEAHLSDEQRAQIVAALRQRKHHAGSADRSVVLWGATEIVQPHLSSADLQFLENRKFTRAEICAAFGVPEEILTSTDHAKYDVMQGARLNFIENRIAPLCARLEAEEQALVKTLDPNAVGWFDLDSLPILQQARRSRLAAAKVGFDMGVPFNELNKVFDLGFSELPWGNAGYLPANLQKIGDLPPAPAKLKVQGSTPEVQGSPSSVQRPHRDMLELIQGALKILAPTQANSSLQGVPSAPATSPPPAPTPSKRDMPELIQGALKILASAQAAPASPPNPPNASNQSLTSP